MRVFQALASRAEVRTQACTLPSFDERAAYSAYREARGGGEATLGGVYSGTLRRSASVLVRSRVPGVSGKPANTRSCHHRVRSQPVHHVAKGPKMLPPMLQSAFESLLPGVGTQGGSSRPPPGATATASRAFGR